MNVAFNTLRMYITIYHTYRLLYCKEHIQITGNYSTINLKNKNNRVDKMKTLQVIYQK